MRRVIYIIALRLVNSYSSNMVAYLSKPILFICLLENFYFFHINRISLKTSFTILAKCQYKSSNRLFYQHLIYTKITYHNPIICSPHLKHEVYILLIWENCVWSCLFYCLRTIFLFLIDCSAVGEVLKR